MWPLYPLVDAFVGITITSQKITCTWVEQAAAGYCLKARSSRPLDNHEVMHGVLYSPSAIKHFISGFLQKNNLANAYAVIALENYGDYSQAQIMQYQLMALAIPLHCIMITACQESEADETAHAINLYTLGKQIYENAT